MSLFVLGSSGLQTALTLSQAASQVARVVGAQDSPEAVGATEAIQQIIRRISGENWDYLSVRGDDIPLVDHQSVTIGQEGYQGQYTVPAPFRDFVSASVRLGNEDGPTPLRYIHRIDWDKWITEAAGLGTRYLSTFPLGLSQKIELLDPPTSAGTMEIRYWRPMAVPEDPDQALDLPDGPLLTAVIELSKAIVATDKGEHRKARIHREDGERDLGKARLADRVHAWADHQMVPEHAWNEQRFKRYFPWGEGVE